MTDERICFDLGQHGFCAVAQCRGVKPEFCRSKATQRAIGPQRGAASRTERSSTGSGAFKHRVVDGGAAVDRGDLEGM
jgi:hypothetical protein